jgi:hypothetical protein
MLDTREDPKLSVIQGLIFITKCHRVSFLSECAQCKFAGQLLVVELGELKEERKTATGASEQQTGTKSDKGPTGAGSRSGLTGQWVAVCFHYNMPLTHSGHM